MSQSVRVRARVMYHGKYADAERSRDSHGQWWLTAGCCGLVVTLAFVSFTLWLGMESKQSETPGTDFHYNINLPPVVPTTINQYPRPQKPPVFRTTEEPPTRPVRTEEADIAVRPSKGKVEKVHKEEAEDKRPTHLKLPLPHVPFVHHDTEDVREYKGTLSQDDDIMNESTAKESNIRKKSEAIFPAGFDPDTFISYNSFQPKREDTNYFSNRERPEIPPFTYIKHPSRLEERIDHKNPNQYYYSESDSSDYEEDDNTILGFFRTRLQDVRDWLSARGSQSSDWLQVLTALNQSVTQRNLTAVMDKLKDMYNTTDVSDVPVSSLLYPDTRNGSSLLSFGLLAVDLFLLHNVQQIAWNEEELGDRMLDDPEVVAMNALFLPPDQLQQLRQKGSRVLKSEDEDKSMLTEALEFVNSMLRAVLNLNKAYRSAGMARSVGPNTMDCVWTLYCRNLDKTAKLQGPYGFLAKMNRYVLNTT